MSTTSIPLALVLVSFILKYKVITVILLFFVSVMLISIIGFAKNKKVQGLLESFDYKKQEMALNEQETAKVSM